MNAFHWRTTRRVGSSSYNSEFYKSFSVWPGYLLETVTTIDLFSAARWSLQESLNIVIISRIIIISFIAENSFDFIMGTVSVFLASFSVLKFCFVSFYTQVPEFQTSRGSDDSALSVISRCSDHISDIIQCPFHTLHYVSLRCRTRVFRQYALIRSVYALGPVPINYLTFNCADIPASPSWTTFG